MKRSNLATVLICAIIAVSAILYFTVPGQVILGILLIKQKENRLVKPEVYEPVATNLAIFCQSFNLLGVTNTYLRTTQLPHPIPTLAGRSWGVVSSNAASVEFGGGFHHYGYSLEQVEGASSENTNVWQLFFRSEGSRDRMLLRFALAVTNRMSHAEYSTQRLQELDRRISSDPENLRAHEERIALLIDTKPEAARAACDDAIKAMPTHWWPQLTSALYEAGQGRHSEGEKAFVKFVKEKPSYSRWMYLAWYYQVLEKPDQAAEAVEQAVQHPVVDLPGDKQNTESRGYSIGVSLYKSGEFKTVQKLCDALLPVRENGNYAKSALLSLKDAAERANAGQSVEFSPSDSMLGFSPYETLAVEKLLSE